jgi:hypothetical protein
MRAWVVVLEVLALGFSGCGTEPLTEIFLAVHVAGVAGGDGGSLACPDASLDAGAPSDAGPGCAPTRIVTLDLHHPPDPDRMGLTAIVGPHRRMVEPPVTWGIVSRDDSADAFEVVARAFERMAGEQPLVEARAQARFVPGEVRVLCLELDVVACGGVTCAANQTCRQGVCVPVCVDETALPPYEDAFQCPAVSWPARAGECVEL